LYRVFAQYSDERNPNKNLKTLAVVFTCNTVVQATFLQNFVWIVLETALSCTCEFLLENFFTVGHRLFYSTFYSLLREVLVKLTTVAIIPITVKHVTISFESLMSLLRHTHGSTIPRINCVTFRW